MSTLIIEEKPDLLPEDFTELTDKTPPTTDELQLAEDFIKERLQAFRLAAEAGPERVDVVYEQAVRPYFVSKLQEEKARIEKEKWPKDANGNKLPALAIHHTVDGEVLGRLQMNGRYRLDYLRTVPLSPSLNNEITQRRFQVPMNNFYQFMQRLKHLAPRRAVPILRSEYLEHIDSKKTLKALCDAGLLKEELIWLYRTETRKPDGKRAVVYFQPQGRAFIRQYIELGYALTENI